MKNDKIFFFFFISFFLVLVSGLAAFNYKFDYGHIFESAQFYDQIIRSRQQGKYIAFSNGDYRLLNERVVRSWPMPEVIVLGSSRMMCIQASSFKGKTFLNHWMSQAVLGDLVGITACYKFYKKKLPKVVVIGLDPWIFNHQHNQKIWRALNPYVDYLAAVPQKLPFYERWLRDIQFYFDRLNLYKLPQLVNLQVTQFNLQELRKGGNIEGVNFAVYDNFKDFQAVFGNQLRDAMLPDGSITENGREEATQRFNKTHANRRFMNFEGQNIIVDDSQEIVRLRQFLRDLKQENAKVYLVLMPCHPLNYRSLLRHGDAANPPPILLAEKIIRSLGREEGIEVLGSYDPQVVGWGPEAFTDELHGREEYVNDFIKKNIADHLN